ncbi:hypothetical protein D0962_22950 [Leptolyngbyaceae cyanobacterium CCMR0082]|uniref:Uncharacterized protein n=1 Tax=Adonisia turfae CCMR0082 TaxID=2304604 RepID=A0A6M0SAP2_9CYAN|nr:hypothetical protein [Adonisia turfae]NEZ65578.1 hypothetical protein [Adonisia turfae CCMR0082]
MYTYDRQRKKQQGTSKSSFVNLFVPRPFAVQQSLDATTATESHQGFGCLRDINGLFEPSKASAPSIQRKIAIDDNKNAHEQEASLSPSQLSSNNLVIQRVVLRPKINEPYQSLPNARWYQDLSPAQRNIVDKMHAEKTHYTKDEVIAHLKSLQPSKKGWQTPPSPAQFPETQKKIAELRFGKAQIDLASLSDTDDEIDDGHAQKYYKEKILKRLEKTKNHIVDRGSESSDSESEVGSDPKALENRRRFKARSLAALTRTFFPLEEDEIAFGQEVGAKRKRDNEAYKKASQPSRQMYARDTREDFARIGEEMKLTSMEHNPYLRRAFRAGVSLDKVKEGGSTNYNQCQGKIREKLPGILTADQEKMHWEEKDFPGKPTWQAFQHMKKEGISNAPKDTYADRVSKGEDTQGATTRSAFHHVAWKEADKDFGPHALNPANLVALNDQRELLNPAKRKKAEEKGSIPTPGAHDIFGHQAQGFRADQSKAFARSKGGGQFKDIDMEAVYHTAKVLMKPRERKKDLYAP